MTTTPDEATPATDPDHTTDPLPDEPPIDPTQSPELDEPETMPL